METVLLAFVVCAANAFCFALGVKVGQSVVKGEPAIQMPKIVTPKKKEKMKKENYEIVLENIENYDGTPAGQKDIPWR